MANISFRKNRFADETFQHQSFTYDSLHRDIQGSSVLMCSDQICTLLQVLDRVGTSAEVDGDGPTNRRQGVASKKSRRAMIRVSDLGGLFLLIAYRMLYRDSPCYKAAAAL